MKILQEQNYNLRMRIATFESESLLERAVDNIDANFSTTCKPKSIRHDGETFCANHEKSPQVLAGES